MNEEVPIMSNSNTKIVKSDNLSFEYASKVKLYDIVSIEDGEITSDNILIDTYTLGKNKVLIIGINLKLLSMKLLILLNH